MELDGAINEFGGVGVVLCLHKGRMRWLNEKL